MNTFEDNYDEFIISINGQLNDVLINSLKPVYDKMRENNKICETIFNVLKNMPEYRKLEHDCKLLQSKCDFLTHVNEKQKQMISELQNKLNNETKGTDNKNIELIISEVSQEEVEVEEAQEVEEPHEEEVDESEDEADEEEEPQEEVVEVDEADQEEVEVEIEESEEEVEVEESEVEVEESEEEVEVEVEKSEEEEEVEVEESEEEEEVEVEESEVEESEEEDEELFIIEIEIKKMNKKKVNKYIEFYTNDDENGNIYLVEDDEDIGDMVGKFNNGEPEFNKDSGIVPV